MRMVVHNQSRLDHAFFIPPRGIAVEIKARGKLELRQFTEAEILEIIEHHQQRHGLVPHDLHEGMTEQDHLIIEKRPSGGLGLSFELFYEE